MFTNIKTAGELALEKALVDKAVAKQQALQEYTDAVEVMIGKVPHTEIASWPKQEQEARDLLSPTPMIDQLVISRGLGETREILAAKIIANADAYAVGYAMVLGEYQAKLKALI